ncbi:nuclease [Bdellovibrio sp. ZAP7]|uniref:endonuclease I family protein n=1 Tax=Bdellovibrio sp. ZAP7 TaxID=2231053 RepID=UPI00115AEAC8|nr:endonuclease [Bdellovibrio sp. ZAP7]QDK46225.1 nuclease [Bdellovibrio sp. ZAP7]
MKLTQLIKSVIVFSTLFFVGAAYAAQTSQAIPYYGVEFYQDLASGKTDADLIYRIKSVLRSYHIPQDSDYDMIVSDCQAAKGCYAHTKIGYNGARVWLMGKFYLAYDQNSHTYSVKDFYCDNYKTRADFRSRGAPAPGSIPDNTVVNVEHTWPQSLFSRRFDKDTQKSDLHHLFPTDSQLNSIRGNQWFGEVKSDTQTLKCTASRFGIGDGDRDEIFEPPQSHKGHVARALFYFSLRYDLPIPPDEEAILRKWNRENPPDDEELDRNNKIFEAQFNRNPFVDYPTLVDSISDF